MAKPPTPKELHEQISTLQQQQQLMMEQLSWMRLVLKMAGVDGPWVTPQIAAAATGRSRDRIMRDIETAEEWRTAKGKKWNMVYGVHYRNDQGIDASQATWKVHLLEYYEFTKVPPDQIKVA
ncbi:hypothetical protein [Leptolyngbya sp. FACHB-16]|uniref:hypothetical protein n=1 Tax=unclassified Leptolyngbya TaxID=2650499 RepID=UPI0016886EFF|nr:hypothetical protein [Leptolyngbya sp. FACHB-16]MBD2156293.1 hypothetical protein [Leptolyngbya sp. FACHB-16]